MADSTGPMAPGRAALNPIDSPRGASATAGERYCGEPRAGGLPVSGRCALRTTNGPESKPKLLERRDPRTSRLRGLRPLCALCSAFDFAFLRVLVPLW